MRLGSLCTGIGGLDLAVEAHFGAELAWYSEVEPAPCVVLERTYPGVPNLGDLTALDWSTVPPVDILTAGYPCQPFSHAGKRKGSNDARHLWPHIAEAVRVLRPRVVVLENVRGHLSLGFAEVLGSLAEAGFDAEWCVLRASDVGACHQRARLFVVATDAGGERHGSGQDTGGVGRVDRGDAGAARERQRARTVTGDRSREAVADAADLGHERGGSPRRGWDGPADDHQDAADTDGGRLEVCPQQHGQPLSHPSDRDSREGHADGLGDVVWGQYAAAIDRHARVLGRPASAPTDDGRLSPRFVEWMMGYPEGWVDGLTRTQALKALGNAVVPAQAAAALRELAPLSHPAERMSA